jgi:hypothetical protein
MSDKPATPGLVPVFKFRAYDVVSDDMQMSQRMATREAILQIAHGEVPEHTRLDVEPAALGSEIPGMTIRGFGPHSLRPPGFQKTMT